MRNKIENVRIGDFNEDVSVDWPTMAKYQKFKKEFLESSMLDEWDVYLWGAWPDRQTKDIDFLLSKGEGVKLDSAEMSEIAKANFMSGMVDNGLYTDIGFTDQKIYPFDYYLDKWAETGETIPTTGYVYGKDMHVDNKRIRNRLRGMQLVGSTEDNKILGKPATSVGNQIYKTYGEQPYYKLTEAYNKGDYSMYTGKPLKVKNKRT